LTCTWALSCTQAFRASRPISATGLDNLTAVAASEGHSVLGTTANVAITEFLLDTRIVVSHALPVLRPVLPIIAAKRIDLWSVYIDVVVVPIDISTPIVAAGGPSPQRIAGAEHEPRGDETAANVAWIAKVVGRIFRIWPPAVHDNWIIVRNIDDIRIGGFYCNDLPALPLTFRDFLFVRRREFIVGLCPQTKLLNGVHNVFLLCQ
jgi:hypothetical protein